MANEFNVDKSEYHSVFKVFDKDNEGTISIKSVTELINALEDLETTNSSKESSAKQANPATSAKNKSPKKLPT
jgi:Ca2+-binding EF-hand superfamily protein